MEEETRLKHETRNLRTWFAEEWRAVHKLAETLNSFTGDKGMYKLLPLYICTHNFRQLSLKFCTKWSSVSYDFCGSMHGGMAN